METKVAELLNVTVDTETGRVFLEMEVIDPVWKQRIKKEWQTADVKLVIDKKDK